MQEVEYLEGKSHKKSQKVTKSVHTFTCTPSPVPPGRTTLLKVVEMDTNIVQIGKSTRRRWKLEKV